MSGRRSGEQRAKDGRYQATIGPRSVDKRSSAGQSCDCRSVSARCSTVHLCLSGGGSIVARLRLCADNKIQRKKNRRTTGEENITWHLRQKIIGRNRTQRRPMVHSTVASYVLFWSCRRQPPVGLGNVTVTVLQEQKLATEVRGNYLACRFMPISYPERSLYFSFHCDTNKQETDANNAKSTSLETNSEASGSCLKHR